MLPKIPPAVVAHIRRTGHRRYWLLLARDPAAWLPALERAAAQPWPPPPPPAAPEPALPPLAAMAGTYARSTARHLLAGRPTADDATRDARLAACRACDLYRPSDDRCSACGCPALEKSVRLLESCPVDRWPA